jgi:YfiH family protein
MTGALITIPALEGAGTRHFFGTRGGQELLPAAWRRRIVSVQQVHGTDALVLDRPVEAGEIFAGGWDALVTDQPGVLVTVRTADCVPVLIHDPKRRVVAAVHAGWRGAVAGILPRTLALLTQRFHSAPSSLHIGIGPSVGACCYEVDAPVLEQLRQACPDWRTVAEETGREKAMLDLKALVSLQAQRAGVAPERIGSVNVCTVGHPELFYSYRREGKVIGAMVSGIMLSK